jgi:alkyl hydroperoxide reductase subunit D
MSLSAIIESMPDYARDVKVNLQNVLAQQELTEQQTWTTAVACALACRNERLSQAILAEAVPKLTPEAMNSAKAAFAVMGMNNIFYRFRHMVGREEYATMPARLRMQAIRSHGGDPADFELNCLAVSAINGCEMCLRSHEAAVREKGLKEEHVMAAVRIASTLHAAAGVIEAQG